MHWKRIEDWYVLFKNQTKADAIQFTVDQTAPSKSKQSRFRREKKLLDAKTENKIVYRL
jgi:hypothetical protein